MDIGDFLRSCVPLFEGIDEEQARRLAQAATAQRYRKGQTILFKGVTVDGLFIVASGKVGVYARSMRFGPIAHLGAGEVFGETSIVEMGTAGAAIKCEEDDTVVYVLPQETFREFAAENPSIGARVHALIESRRPKTPVAA